MTVKKHQLPEDGVSYHVALQSYRNVVEALLDDDVGNIATMWRSHMDHLKMVRILQFIHKVGIPEVGDFAIEAIARYQIGGNNVVGNQAEVAAICCTPSLATKLMPFFLAAGVDTLCETIARERLERDLEPAECRQLIEAYCTSRVHHEERERRLLVLARRVCVQKTDFDNALMHINNHRLRRNPHDSIWNRDFQLVASMSSH